MNNHKNSLTRGSDEQLNEETIFTRYGDVVLPDGEEIHPCSKDYVYTSMCDFPKNDIKLPKWPCMLNCCS